MKNPFDVLQQNKEALRLCQPSPNQRGSVMIIGLIFLVCLTTLSLSGGQSAVFNQRMASNDFESERENHWAESAIQQAIKNDVWKNKAIGYSKVGVLLSPKALPPASEWHVINDFTQDVKSAPTVKVGMLARSGAASGNSFDLDFQLIEVFGQTEVPSGTSNNGMIVQGFLAITAQKAE
jgi:Tfp pilus assembly protein PilX